MNTKTIKTAFPSELWFQHITGKPAERSKPDTKKKPTEISKGGISTDGSCWSGSGEGEHAERSCRRGTSKGNKAGGTIFFSTSWITSVEGSISIVFITKHQAWGPEGRRQKVSPTLTKTNHGSAQRAQQISLKVARRNKRPDDRRWRTTNTRPCQNDWSRSGNWSQNG